MNLRGCIKKNFDTPSYSVGLLGFEPRKTGPESVVLPLHHSPMFYVVQIYAIYEIHKRERRIFLSFEWNIGFFFRAE